MVFSMPSRSEPVLLTSVKGGAAGCLPGPIMRSVESISCSRANTAAFVASSAQGRVLDGEAALAAAFAGGDLLDLARRARRPWLYDLAFSGMTADLLEQSVAA